MKKILCFVILAITIGCQRVPEESCMAVEFLQGDENIIFSDSQSADESIVSISFWAYFDTADAGTIRTIFHQYKSDNSASSFYIGHTSAGIHVILRDADTPTNPKLSISDGGWIGGWKHVYIVPMWDANYSKVYIDGIEAGYTTNEADAITRETELGGDISIGGPRSGSGYSIDGKLQDVRIYNRILSASEIAEAGLSSFDGATLSSANTIIDRISGVQGIPSGSPIGRGNTIQRIY